MEFETTEILTKPNYQICICGTKYNPDIRGSECIVCIDKKNKIEFKEYMIPKIKQRNIYKKRYFKNKKLKENEE